jgi:hypothetical protein
MWAFIVDFPIKNGDFPIVMLVYQRVSSIVFFLHRKKSIKHWDFLSQRLGF